MTIRFNERRIREVFDSPRGPVGRFLGRTGVAIESAAKALVTEERLVRTGRYRSSIAWSLASEGGLTLKVGSNVSYAGFLEKGTPPHVIAARSKKALWWDMPNDRGWMVQPDSGHPVRYVKHPGNRPYRILTRASRSVLQRGTR